MIELLKRGFLRKNNSLTIKENFSKINIQNTEDIEKIKEEIEAINLVFEKFKKKFDFLILICLISLFINIFLLIYLIFFLL
ncbi:hypothetical protein EV215_0278 [Hypnocyclicus thermotrophus]|uniref:Uncharacterized protein n=1 Tax=Hypnocyclicus thermotrophus TaxID=1627895 RepID=A0AA46E0B7_9FUSO|nr:hypothetical protein [Hypnocyclicus thermotrophus]TDT72472.1 hypothetical protein EV215_0278 [Hypnocyclicus thermotrophus]